MRDLLNAQIKSNENIKTVYLELEKHYRKAQKTNSQIKQHYQNSQHRRSTICTCSMDLQEVIFLLQTITKCFIRVAVIKHKKIKILVCILVTIMQYI